MISLSKETEALAQRLAAARNVSVEETIRQALEHKAEAEGIAQEPRRPRDRSPEAIAARRQRAQAIIKEIAAMPINDPRPISEIVDDLNAL